MEIDKIKQYKKLDHRGVPYKYYVNDVVLYRDRLFTLVLLAPLKTPPTKKSIYWKELLLPNRTISSTSKPVGIKFLGDNWFNPITNLTYTYTKNNGQYLWLSY